MPIPWDSAKLFARQFGPVEGGYLFYPRAKGPAKLVSPEEYDALLTDYRRWMGRGWRPGLLFVALFGAVVMNEIVSLWLGFSEEASLGVFSLLGLLFAAKVVWLQLAPRRLVRGRPDAAPPRTKAQRARATRAMVPWLMLVWPGLIATVAALMGVLALAASQSPRMGTILWTLFWIAALVSLGRTAVQKYRDGRA